MKYGDIMERHFPGSAAEPLSSAYAAQFGTAAAFAAAPLGSVLGSAAAAAAGKQVEGTLGFNKSKDLSF